MSRPITGGAGAVYAILKARMTSQLFSKTMANSNWRTCTFTEVRGDIQGRIKDFIRRVADNNRPPKHTLIYFKLS